MSDFFAHLFLFLLADLLETLQHLHLVRTELAQLPGGNQTKSGLDLIYSHVIMAAILASIYLRTTEIYRLQRAF